MRKSDIKRWERAIALIEQAREALVLTADNVFMQDDEYVKEGVTVNSFLNNEITDIGLEIHVLKCALHWIKDNQEQNKL